ncbi:hypothetical protein I302_100168 [Kwoniella bestiolae CBS 10118]|uniref:Exosome complex component MTR3 n=1 Tax=Kwoniella bestiolae CBS 10118 TaxID=1296100 RepID=A0A1B9G4A9_9TREE|nr:exosome complex component MTR3 [Kwoniella bestiolae CBS 10118]OCF25869.1 exosome complex component MTR3 [Kwoniella bestiolae CBS 10118]
MATAFDRRRIPAPEVSVPPIYEDSPEAGPSTRTRRVDRAIDEARPIFLKTGLISQANGSGYIESGGVKIACSVYGPRPKAPPYTPQGTLNLEVKFAPFASDPRRAPLRDTEPISLSQLLTQSLLPTIQLHLLPKSSIDIYLLVLESDTPTNVLSAGLTVASAAIADAGIAMYALGTGSVIAHSSAEGLLLDPEEGEEGEAEGILTLGSMPALGKVTGLVLEGEVGVDQAVEMIEKAISASRDTHTVLAQSLIEGAQERGIGGEAE